MTMPGLMLFPYFFHVSQIKQDILRQQFELIEYERKKRAINIELETIMVCKSKKPKPPRK